jgi:hypothetical protein
LTDSEREPGEQKTAIGYFLDKIEVMRDKGVARCYFYEKPRMKEVDYSLPSTGVSIPQDGAEGSVYHLRYTHQTPSKHIIIDFPLSKPA